MADAEKADRLIKIQPAMRRIGKPQSIEQVRSHSLMREQAPILKNIASTPPPGGHIDSGAAVKQHLFTHGYAPFIRAQQTGNHVEQAGLARPRWAEQCGQACTGAPRQANVPVTDPTAHLDFKGHYAQRPHSPPLPPPPPPPPPTP